TDAVLADDVLNTIATDDRAARAVRIAGQRIVDVGVRPAEIAGAYRRRGHCLNEAVVLPVLRAFVAGKEEELVLDYGAAKRPAILVLNKLALHILRWAEIVSGLQRLVGMVFESGTVKIIRPALDLDVDRRAASQTLLGVETVGHDVDGLDRFERGHIRRHVRQPDVGRTDPVNARVVGRTAGAVDVEDQRTRRV